MPAQHGWPTPPQVPQVPPVPQALPASVPHTAPLVTHWVVELPVRTQQPPASQVLLAQHGPPGTPHLVQFAPVAPGEPEQSDVASTQLGVVRQQGSPVLPHSQLPPRQIPGLGEPQVPFSATQVPLEQQPLPSQRLPGQQGPPGTPHLAQKVSPVVGEVLQTVPDSEHWSVPAVLGQQRWPALPHWQLPAVHMP